MSPGEIAGIGGLLGLFHICMYLIECALLSRSELATFDLLQICTGFRQQLIGVLALMPCLFVIHARRNLCRVVADTAIPDDNFAGLRWRLFLGSFLPSGQPRSAGRLGGRWARGFGRLSR